jgi:hypothetical protein
MLEALGIEIWKVRFAILSLALFVLSCATPPETLGTRSQPQALEPSSSKVCLTTTEFCSLLSVVWNAFLLILTPRDLTGRGLLRLVSFGLAVISASHLDCQLRLPFETDIARFFPLLGLSFQLSSHSNEIELCLAFNSMPIDPSKQYRDRNNSNQAEVCDEVPYFPTAYHDDFHTLDKLHLSCFEIQA